jgi:integrase/recombinase XerD
MSTTEVTDPRKTEGAPASGIGSRPAEVLTADEIRALLRATNRGATGARNRALITMFYRGGLRLSEALALRPSDVDTTTGEVRILRGKGGKARTVALDPNACAIVDGWLVRRAKLGLRNGKLFCQVSKRAKGQPVGPTAVHEMLKRLAEKAGIEKRVHAHGFRHAFAAELSRERVPVAEIRQLLGHSNLAVTTRYLDSLNPAEAVAAIRAREWEIDPE